MKNWPYILVAALMLYAFGIGLGYADTPSPIQMTDHQRLSFSGGQASFVSILHDRDTGCDYIVYDGMDHGAAITPRMYDAGGGRVQLCRKP